MVSTEVRSGISPSPHRRTVSDAVSSEFLVALMSKCFIVPRLQVNSNKTVLPRSFRSSQLNAMGFDPL